MIVGQYGREVRVAFWLPDFGGTTGGLSAAYRFARYLQEDGRDVVVVRESGKPAHGIPAELADGLPIAKVKQVTEGRMKDCVLVVPEIRVGSPDLQRSTVPRIVLNQNPFLTGAMEIADATYRSPHLLGAVATSDYTASYLSFRYPGMPLTRIYLGIDLDLFDAAPRGGRQRVIAWMPRKRLPDAELVIAAVSDDLTRRGWRLDAIDGIGERDVAARLMAADVFMAFSEREGFGLPVAEAMATGTACVGFTGVGGDEVLTAQTGWPVPEGDVVTFANELLRVASAIDAGDADVERRTTAARTLVEEKYTRAHERASTLAAFAALLH
jgi:hypothetical protein